MSRLTIGIMSGTSLDGADGALVDWPSGRVIAFSGSPFAPSLRNELLGLCSPGDNEIDRMGRASISLAKCYAEVVRELLNISGRRPEEIGGIGCHGQTVRHRPANGFTVQIQNASVLAELTGISVVADFRSRDLAAGGQGAPLAPAFHEAVFGKQGERRAVVNIGGISNATILDGKTCVTGFDCGPGNVLLDHWAQKHLGKSFDENGAWSASAKPDNGLLQELLDEPFFKLPPPKSTGRELFNEAWLTQRLSSHVLSPAEVQATLLELTAQGIHQSLLPHGPLDRVLVCGGGARNGQLMQRLNALLDCPTDATDAFGIAATQVEAVAFAWLADSALQGKRLNLGHITGSKHPVPLGCIYPA